MKRWLERENLDYQHQYKKIGTKRFIAKMLLVLEKNLRRS